MNLVSFSFFCSCSGRLPVCGYANGKHVPRQFDNFIATIFVIFVDVCGFQLIDLNNKPNWNKRMTVIDFVFTIYLAI